MADVPLGELHLKTLGEEFGLRGNEEQGLESQLGQHKSAENSNLRRLFVCIRLMSVNIYEMNRPCFKV